ncbi:TMEM43 family protein [Chamaesiphon sp. VAR_69_metabat_338]|uniref:TMEM43 family protein n=1 Tax=Chamaesiphon sp. VAR_69_metabat_338 TaxID=2964704 RepID=UPI00286DBE24|nr:TMEM43 family protein [Chamaesiphon sp. VAR_69_metabat_338]
MSNSSTEDDLLVKLIAGLIAFIVGTFMVVCAVTLFSANERQTNLAEAVRNSIDITTRPNAADLEHKLISVTDRISTDSLLGDGRFLKAGAYLAIDRLTEEYVREERSRETTSSNQERQETTPSPQSSPPNRGQRNRDFKSLPRNNPSQSSRNPSASPTNNPVQSSQDSNSQPRNDREYNYSWKIQRGEYFYPVSANVGRYQLDMQPFHTANQKFHAIKNPLVSCPTQSKTYVLSSLKDRDISIRLPSESGLLLTTENTQIPSTPIVRDGRLIQTQLLPQYIFQGTGQPNLPSVGDTRTCYAVLQNNTQMTIFSGIKRDRLIQYQSEYNPILRLAPGSRSEAIALIGRNYHIDKWGSRCLGFVLMLMGLAFACLPVSLFPGQIPGFRWVDPNPNSLAYCFIPAVLVSLISIVMAYFSPSIIPAMAISAALLMYLTIRRHRSSQR